ncbi:MAG: nucleotide sugar dehydrogenase, partial [Rhodospirillaceae bacterium]|nr:nucleotide sugar dehydrogenase [Rhodospirillaceae bacterium]
RDVNIALMNELAVICHHFGIDTGDVLSASGTKWNFLPFGPGLVGGHCIGVDPYYLTHRAEKAGYHAQVILSGRRINDDMGGFVARETIKALMGNGCAANPVVTVLGLTFKEDVPDIRNTRVVDILAELKAFGVRVQVADAMADAAEVAHEYGLTLSPFATLDPADAIILAVPHRDYRALGWDITRLLKDGKGFIADVKGCLNRDQKPANIDLWRL